MLVKRQLICALLLFCCVSNTMFHALPALSAQSNTFLDLPIKMPAQEDAESRILDLKPLYLSNVLKTQSSKYIQLEASYDQSITLSDALTYVLNHGLPLKISQCSYRYQHWLTLSNVASALPSFFMNYNLYRANIFNVDTRSIGRTFVTGMNFPVFQGGGIVYSILSQHYREKGW